MADVGALLDAACAGDPVALEGVNALRESLWLAAQEIVVVDLKNETVPSTPELDARFDALVDVIDDLDVELHVAGVQTAPWIAAISQEG